MTDLINFELHHTSVCVCSHNLYGSIRCIVNCRFCRFFFFLGFPIGKNSITYNSKISLCIGLLESGSFIWFPVVKGEQRKHNHLEFSPA